MTKEFKKLTKGDETRYVLETMTAGATGASSIATAEKDLGEVQRRNPEPPKPRNFVAKNAKMGGAGAHKDKKKDQKQGNVKHKKPFAEAGGFVDVSKMSDRDVQRLGHHDDPEGDAWQRRQDARPKVVAWIFYDVKPGQEDQADSLKIRQLKNGKWAMPEYDKSGSTYRFQRNQADKMFGPGKKWVPKNEGAGEKNPQHSHQYDTTMKHADNPSVQQRMAAHDIKPGIAGYRDRVDLLKDLERTGKLKKEDSNPEYDDEAGMADNNLETLKRAVQGLDDLIGAGDNLPEWCQEKIAIAKSMLVAVWDYMQSEEQNVEEDAPFGSNYAEQLAQQVFDHNPKLDDEDKILNLGYNIAKSELGSRAQGIFRDEDFPSDFVSAYSYLQKQGMGESAPKGWEGTVKAMKKHKDEIDNPWALAHWMKNKGYKSHKEDAYMESLFNQLEERSKK